MARRGLAWHGPDWSGGVRHGMAGEVWRREVGYGTARSGAGWWGAAWQAWPGRGRRGPAWQARPGVAGAAWLGVAWLGVAWQAWLGKAGRGVVGRGRHTRKTNMTTNTTITLDPSQRRAVDLACTATLGLITGGPGVGKSTTLGHALDILDQRGESYELASPTGKAARRMYEATGRDARTIHRLLGFHPHEGWKRNRANPLTCSVVIVDESSMIDIELAAALTNAIDPTCTRLIMIGDANQLPPVGPGRVFGDLVDSRLVPTVRLDTLHRAARESWVCQNAPRVLTGDMLDLAPRRDFLWIPVESAGDVLTHVQRVIVDHLPTFAQATGGADAQTLIPQRPGVAGIHAANRLLQARFNPRVPDAPYLQRGQPDDADRVEIRVGDRVIQTRNDYALGVFNGETGEITDIAHGHVCVQFVGRELVTYTLEQANALELAYALTVHRAQGSEFPWVVVVCHSTHSYVLSRQLLYTAITRAKVGVVLIGDARGLARALSDARPATRNTTLIERMRARLNLADDPPSP